MMTLTRRQFLATGVAAGVAASAPVSAQEALPPMFATALQRVRTPNKHPDLVLAPSYVKGAYDALAVDCPFVFRDGDRFYMTHIGFDGTGYRTGLASSDNLVRWIKEGVILDRGPAGSVTEFNVALTWILRDNDLFGSGTLRKIGGRYLGTYHAYPKPGYETGPAVIGLCWSDDYRHWELEEPILSASDEGAGNWERGGLYKSCLVEYKGTFYLFYNAKTAESPWKEQTGVAISKDLKRWERHASNPIVPVGPPGAFDDVFCSDPCVLQCDDKWAMFFYTLSSDGKARDTVAFSDDLLHWTKSGEILIDVGPPESIDSRYAHKPSVFSHEGLLYHFYCAVSPPKNRKEGDLTLSETRGIAVATT